MSLEKTRTYTLVTRSDMDGIACAALLRARGMVDALRFAHPKDMRDGLVPVGADDIVVNLPYVPGAFLTFGTQPSDGERLGLTPRPKDYMYDETAPSCARVIWNYFGGQEGFPNIHCDLIETADKSKSAQFTQEEVLTPTSWPLLAILTDPRTGLGRFRHFDISNYVLMEHLTDLCLTQSGHIDIILADQDTVQRIDFLRAHREAFEDQVRRCIVLRDEGVAILDLRNEEIIWPGSRFALYALFPDIKVCLSIFWGRSRQNTVFSLGLSPFISQDSPCPHLGALAFEYGGDGKKRYGTFQVENIRAETVKSTILARLMGHV